MCILGLSATSTRGIMTNKSSPQPLEKILNDRELLESKNNTQETTNSINKNSNDKNNKENVDSVQLPVSLCKLCL